MVLSITGNKVASEKDFQVNAKRLLPNLALLNPPEIKKVSCFENFKELAFGKGL